MSAASPDVLLVEDNPDIREALQELLVDLGRTVVSASQGREALDLLQRGLLPRLALVDLMMPVMDGLQLRTELALDARLAAIPVVMVTAHPRAQGLQGLEVLPKPIDLDHLMRVLDRYCPK